MIRGYSPVAQALLGTLFTWGLTAAGAALVIVFSSTKRKVLDASLGFAAGVMTAASYWSLLAPALELAGEDTAYGKLAFLPVSVGFVLGALFVYGADVILPAMGGPSANISLALSSSEHEKQSSQSHNLLTSNGESPSFVGVSSSYTDSREGSQLQRRKAAGGKGEKDLRTLEESEGASPIDKRSSSWHRILLLIIAIVVHNIPEGLAVGVGFGAIGTTESATFENARNLAIGIGLQNFPEGLAVSLPLRAAGFSKWRSFWYGQLSGMVEPIAGLLGAWAVSLAEPLLPYSLAFAAGAMIYVVVDDIIPEGQSCGNGKLCSWGAIVGFVIMMSMDVGLS